MNTRTLRVGSRGSELALTQMRWVCSQLRQRSSDLTIEEVIITTHGDQHSSQSVMAEEWPMGGFTGAIERALLEKRIDFAVHSLKDLPVEPAPGTAIAGIPPREAANDVLITAKPVALDSLRAGMRIGTSSPRRAAQIRRLADVQTLPLRGNVPTRIGRVGRDLDGIILAAAGLARLGLTHPNMIDLPLDRFLPAPGQGALAVQAREDDHDALETIETIDHPHTRLAVTAERAMLAHLGGGCAAPVGAHATVEDGTILLRGQVFSTDGKREAIGEARGDDPIEIARSLAQYLKDQLAGPIQ